MSNAGKKNKETILGAIILACCFAILYAQSLFRTSAPQATDITLPEAQTMYEQFGGEAGSKPVTMFATSWCSVCEGLSAELQNRGIKFVRVDVEKDQEALLFFQRATGGQTSGVPVTLVGTELVLGYNMPAITAALERM